MQCRNCECELKLDRRHDQRYCSSKCRAQATRNRKAAEQQAAAMLSDANRLYLTLKRKPASRTQEAMNNLKLLRDNIDQLLRMYDRETMIERAQRDELIGRTK